MNDKQPSRKNAAWIQTVRARGWVDAVCTGLDMLEPIRPLAIPLLLVMQPVSGSIGVQGALADIIAALEQPDGIQTLRHTLRSAGDTHTDDV